MHQMSTKNFAIFKRLKEWGVGSSTWRRYCAWGLTLCAAAVRKLLHISQYHLRQFNAEIAQGHDMPQRMLTETQQQRNERGAWTKADAILQWLHDQVAEDLAESVRVAGEGDEVPASTRPSRLPQEPGIALKDELYDCGVRWLPPGTTLAEMLDLGLTFLPDHQVTYSTFVKCYHMSWEKKLKI